MRSAKCEIGFAPYYFANMDENIMKTQDNIIETKSFDFAIKIINLYKIIVYNKNERTLATQILRSGTSIGANVTEAQKGQSKADFYAKMNVALKEANETYYWLRLLSETDYISNKEFINLENDIKEIISILVAITKQQKTNS